MKKFVLKVNDADAEDANFTTIEGPTGDLEQAVEAFKRTMENVGVAESMGVNRFRSLRGSVYVLSAVEVDSEEESSDSPIDPTEETIL